MQALVLIALLAAIFAVLWYQSSPIQYYLYHLLPLACWAYVFSHRHTFRATWQPVATNRPLLAKGAVALVVVGVAGFFYREMLSVFLVVVSLWPYLLLPTTPPAPDVLWTLLCWALAVVPLLPVGGRGTHTPSWPQCLACSWQSSGQSSHLKGHARLSRGKSP